MIGSNTRTKLNNSNNPVFSQGGRQGHPACILVRSPLSAVTWRAETPWTTAVKTVKGQLFTSFPFTKPVPPLIIKYGIVNIYTSLFFTGPKNNPAFLTVRRDKLLHMIRTV